MVMEGEAAELLRTVDEELKVRRWVVCKKRKERRRCSTKRLVHKTGGKMRCGQESIDD